jgi:hypothetical protein
MKSYKPGFWCHILACTLPLVSRRRGCTLSPAFGALVPANLTCWHADRRLHRSFSRPIYSYIYYSVAFLFFVSCLVRVFGSYGVSHNALSATVAGLDFGRRRPALGHTTPYYFNEHQRSMMHALDKGVQPNVRINSIYRPWAGTYSTRSKYYASVSVCTFCRKTIACIRYLLSD